MTPPGKEAPPAANRGRKTNRTAGTLSKVRAPVKTMVEGAE